MTWRLDSKYFQRKIIWKYFLQFNLPLLVDGEKTSTASKEDSKYAEEGKGDDFQKKYDVGPSWMSPSEHELGPKSVPSWNPDSPQGANNTENVLDHPNLSDLVLLLILFILPLTTLLSIFYLLLLSL